MKVKDTQFMFICSLFMCLKYTIRQVFRGTIFLERNKVKATFEVLWIVYQKEKLYSSAYKVRNLTNGVFPIHYFPQNIKSQVKLHCFLAPFVPTIFRGTSWALLTPSAFLPSSPERLKLKGEIWISPESDSFLE